MFLKKILSKHPTIRAYSYRELNRIFPSSKVISMTFSCIRRANNICNTSRPRLKAYTTTGLRRMWKKCFRQMCIIVSGYHIYTDGIRPLSSKLPSSETFPTLYRSYKLQSENVSEDSLYSAGPDKTKEAKKNDRISLMWNEEEVKTFQKLKDDSANATLVKA